MVAPDERKDARLHTGFLDEATHTLVRGWAVSKEGIAPMLTFWVDGEPVQTFRPSLQREDLEGKFATARLGFELRINVAAGSEIAVTDLGNNHLQNSPQKAPAEVVHQNDPYNEMMDRYLSHMGNGSGRLLELGSRARSGTTYRHLFPKDIEYVGLDITAGPNVDVVGDAHSLSKVVDGRFDFVFSISTFEHLLMPWKVVLELNKVMNRGGLVFTQSHQTWPLHEQPWDFWRFSTDGWRGLFNAHTGFELVEAAYSQSAQISAISPNKFTKSLSSQPSFLVTGCIAKKIGEPLVSWDADVSSIVDLKFTHGT